MQIQMGKINFIYKERIQCENALAESSILSQVQGVMQARMCPTSPMHLHLKMCSAEPCLHQTEKSCENGVAKNFHLYLQMPI